MLSTVEFIIENKSNNPKVSELVKILTDSNHDNIEFTVHVENSNVRLRLIYPEPTSDFDPLFSIEYYRQSIINILQRRRIAFSVIETLITQSDYQEGQIMD